MPSVEVTFDGTNVTLPADSDIDVDVASIDIDFNLDASAPTGAAIVGIEFPKANEPGGTFAPASVFGNPHNINVNNTVHHLFGTQSGKNLSLADTNNVGPNGTEEDYGYKVWVSYNNTYYCSADPDVRNKPTKG